jgi:MFS family permease
MTHIYLILLRDGTVVRTVELMSAPTGSYPGAYPITEPLPVLTARPTLRATFASLSVPNFRWYTGALAASSAGGWLARIATDWLMVELTGNVALISLVVAFQLLPPMLLAPWGGVVGDRFSARRTVIAVQLLLVAAFLSLAIPAVLSAASVGLIILTSLLVGISAAFEGPSRAVFVVEVVGTRGLANAMGLNAAVQQCAGIVGAAVAGIAIAGLGAGWAMIIGAVGPVVGVIGLLLIRRDRLHPAIKVRAQRGQIREAIHYVRRKNDIGASLLLITVLALFGLTGSVLFGWAARDEFDLGSAGYSLFQAMAALGAFVGSLLAARRRRLRMRDNALLLAVSGAIWAVTGFAPTPALFIVAMVAALITRLMFMVANDSLTQLSTNGAIRARVVSLYMMCATGAQALGAVLTGWSVDALGGQTTFLITGLVPLAVAGSIAIAATIGLRRQRGPRPPHAARVLAAD